jgi:hypothetical protein
MSAGILDVRTLPDAVDVLDGGRTHQEGGTLKKLFRILSRHRRYRRHTIKVQTWEASPSEGLQDIFAAQQQALPNAVWRMDCS